ncbi:MAG TPA: carbohydrate ABC transporter permease [Geminicoccus sp.]|jgi:multiple sugar transport system permease protein|uniref:carbohydrate ABC transporter permease n=1 Tax=Geminicoccus sp. TaxID=2024832 RepID=UPI002E30F668|nr:carbohydrate ABC transporter permease [Geminicoccus sp.]HEX2528678.1 carbohydrate ABC transporter permease [Geminicoccus sp.]
MIVGSRRSRRAWAIATYATVLAFLLFTTLPLIWLVLTSVKPETDIVVAEGVRYWPTSFTFEHYANIWWQSGFSVLVLNSAKTTAMTILICLVAGSLGAYAFSRFRFPGRRQMLLGLLVVRMFPAVVKIIPLFIIMRALGLLDSSFGLALAYSSFLLPLFIWIMKGFFDALPDDLEEAARIDGCTRLGAMIRIVLPLARNGLVATTVFVAIGAWNEFLFALMLTTSQGSRTWPVGLQLMIGEFQLPWGMLAAGGVISIVPVVLLFAFIQRALVSGLTTGAVKG